MSQHASQSQAAASSPAAAIEQGLHEWATITVTLRSGTQLSVVVEQRKVDMCVAQLFVKNSTLTIKGYKLLPMIVNHDLMVRTNLIAAVEVAETQVVVTHQPIEDML